jgi:hypothetical protein
VNPELTPSAAIRDRYYQSNRYLMDKNSASSIDMDDEEDTVDDEEDMLDYRPQDSQLCDNRPTGPPSIYSGSESGSIISLRTEYNDIEDRRSITSIRTVDDRLQGRSLGINLNSFALKTAKRVSRSSTLFRSKNGSQAKLDENTKSLTKRKLEPSSSFVPVRDTFNQGDDSSIKSSGGTSLLSKLSKSTAPVRAKLFAFSALTSNYQKEKQKILSNKIAIYLCK